MSTTQRQVNCPTCRNAFVPGKGVISVCPRCGERVLLPAQDDEEVSPIQDEEVIDLPAVETPEVASIRIACSLCSTRYYAKPSQVGQMLRCPDCHTANQVPEPAEERAAAAPDVPSTEDDDFKLSEPVDTPRYQALSRDALEFERAIRSADGLNVKPVESMLAEASQKPTPQPVEALPDDVVILDEAPASPTTQPTSTTAATPPGQPIQPPPAEEGDIELFPEDRAPAPAPPPPPKVTQQKPVYEEDDEIPVDVPLSAPVERLDSRPVFKLPKPDDPEDLSDPAEVDFGKLGQSLKKMLPQGQQSPELPPEIAAKCPFSSGILSVLGQTAVLGRWVGLALFAVIELWALSFVVSSFEGGAGMQIMGLLVYIGAWIPAILGLVALAIFCLTIFQDTANGFDRIESWPDYSFFDWGTTMAYFASAMFVAALPGALLGAILGLITGFWLFSPLLPPLSFFLFFPPVFISMLEAGTVSEPISKTMLISFQPLARYWIQFYLLSLGMFFAGAASVVAALLIPIGILAVIPAAILLTGLPLVYFRLLGRMGMIYRDYVFAITPEDEQTSDRYVMR